MKASEVVDAARELHPAFGERTAAGPMVLRWLSRYLRRLTGKVLDRNPDHLVVTLQEALPLADFAAGIAVPAHHRVVNLALVSGQNADFFQPIHLVAWSVRDSSNLWPRASLVGTTLRLHGQAVDWQGYTRVEVDYIPMAVDLAGLDTDIPLPDASFDCLVAACGDYLASRAPKENQDPPVDVGRYRQDYLEAERQYLDEVASQKNARTTVTQEVW